MLLVICVGLMLCLEVILVFGYDVEDVDCEIVVDNQCVDDFGLIFDFDVCYMFKDGAYRDWETKIKPKIGRAHV